MSTTIDRLFMQVGLSKGSNDVFMGEEGMIGLRLSDERDSSKFSATFHATSNTRRLSDNADVSYLQLMPGIRFSSPPHRVMAFIDAGLGLEWREGREYYVSHTNDHMSMMLGTELGGGVSVYLGQGLSVYAKGRAADIMTPDVRLEATLGLGINVW